jgi:hypothetical protein
LPGKHFLNHSAAYIVMNAYDLSYGQAKEKLNKELKLDGLNEVEKCLEAERVAFKYMKKHPVLFAKFSITNILKTAFSPFSEELFFIEQQKGRVEKENYQGLLGRIKSFLLPQVSSYWFIFLIYLELIFSTLVFWGFAGFVFNSFFSKNIFLLMLNIGSFIGLFIVISLASGFARLRLPIEPLVFILSFYFWLRLFCKRRNLI